MFVLKKEVLKDKSPLSAEYEAVQDLKQAPVSSADSSLYTKDPEKGKTFGNPSVTAFAVPPPLYTGQTEKPKV